LKLLSKPFTLHVHSVSLPSLEAEAAIVELAVAEDEVEEEVEEEEGVIGVGSLFFSSLASIIFTNSPGISPDFPLSSPRSQPNPASSNITISSPAKCTFSIRFHLNEVTSFE
jgi:hypothetical protein